MSDQEQEKITLEAKAPDPREVDFQIYLSGKVNHRLEVLELSVSGELVKMIEGQTIRINRVESNIPTVDPAGSGDFRSWSLDPDGTFPLSLDTANLGPFVKIYATRLEPGSET